MIGPVMFNPFKVSIRFFIEQPLIILGNYWASKIHLNIQDFIEHMLKQFIVEL